MQAHVQLSSETAMIQAVMVHFQHLQWQPYSNALEDWGPGNNWACLSWKDAIGNVPGSLLIVQITSGDLTP